MIPFPPPLLCASVSLCLCVKATRVCTGGRYPFHWLVVGAVLLIGCLRGGDVVRVNGQLVRDGKPYGANLSGKEPETFAVDLIGIVNERPYRFAATIDRSGSFRVDGAEFVGESGEIVIAPANSSHGFTNTGSGELRLTAIHAAAEFVTQWLGQPDPEWVSPKMAT